jgi:hypothetical protein
VLPQPEGHRRRIEGHTGPARRGDDPAPVGVPAVDGGFHQRGAHHGAGDGPTGIGLAARALHRHLDQTGGPLPIPGDAACQVPRHRRQAGLQGVVVLRWQGFAGGKRQEAVIGAGVAVHGDGVEGALHGPVHHGLPDRGGTPASQLSVGQQGGHGGVDHPDPLAMPPMRTVRPPSSALQGDLLDHQVGGEDGLGRVWAPLGAEGPPGDPDPPAGCPWGSAPRSRRWSRSAPGRGSVPAVRPGPRWPTGCRPFPAPRCRHWPGRNW